jgi:5-methylcytosine-specific restriction endonuclease McrA
MMDTEATTNEAAKRFAEVCEELRSLRQETRRVQFDLHKAELFSEAKTLYDETPWLYPQGSFKDLCEDLDYIYQYVTYAIRIYNNDFLRDYCQKITWAVCIRLLPFIGDMSLSESEVSNLKDFVDARRGRRTSELEEDLKRELERIRPEHEERARQTREEFLRQIKELRRKSEEAEQMLKSRVEQDLDALKEEESYLEGKPIGRYINAYERQPELRLDAIRIHGTKCQVCGFDFGATYGEHGDGYIEVHHLRPVSSLGDDTIVDPLTDMTVLCSNCHRMIHRKTRMILTPEELQAMRSR